MTDYCDFQPASTTREREDIEWTAFRSYNAPDRQSPRALLIGDSISQGYHMEVREKLGTKVNITLWATSKCVTDPDYFRELDYVLDCYPYTLITFNNGLHSLVTPPEEWENAYRQTVKFLRAKLPATLLSLVYSTPLQDPEKTATSQALNTIVQKIAAETALPVVDLFTPMDALPRDKYWSDCYHFKTPAVAMQA